MSFEVPGIVAWIIVGVVAGWLASNLMGRKGSVVSNALLGLVGSLVGGVLFTLVGLSGASNIIGSIVIATVGAVIVLAIVK